MRLSRWGFTLLFAGFSTFATPMVCAEAAPQLKPYTAEYRVSRGKFSIGLARISLTIDSQNQYHYQGYTKPTGLLAVFRKDEITEISKGIIGSSLITPITYRYIHKKSDNTRHVDLDFDWKSNKVTNQTAQSNWSMVIPPKTQDKFSLQLALMMNLSHGKKESSFRVADGGRLKDYRFWAKEQERIDTSAGKFSAVKVIRQKGKRPSRTTLWMSPELNYIPVKIVKNEDDGQFVMELSKISWSSEE